MKKSVKTGRCYGWVKDTIDQRDYMFKLRAPLPIPPTLDLRLASWGTPPIYNQGELGSCTAMGIADAHMFDQMQQDKSKAFMPSHLFIYYNERVMENTVNSDSGAQIRDGIKSIAAQGVCPEPMWPYIVSKFTTPPPKACYTEAMKHQALIYQRVGSVTGSTDINSLQQALASQHPVVFGIPIYASFETQSVARTGLVPMPRKGDRLIGGHCVILYGWTKIGGQFHWICKNSWGMGWGHGGYFYLPKDYVRYMSDCWVVTTVEH